MQSGQSRRYVPIAPANPNPTPPESGNSSSEPTSLADSRKRKRVGVQVACDMCRLKKTRCDGRRPACGYCRQRSLSNCSYSDQRGPHADAVETLNLLRTTPEHEAINLLRLIRDGDPPAVALGYIKGDDDEGRPPAAQSVFEHCLMAQNPVLYPVLRPHATRELEGSNMLRPVNAALQEQHAQMPDPLVDGEPHRNCEPVETAGDVVEADRVGTDSAVRPFRAPLALVHPHKTNVLLCDDRLRSLDIAFWTNVPVSSEFAARVISLYLETDHPLLGTFDPGAFVLDLVNHQTTSCSSLVVNALLYWGSQMYTAIDAEANKYAHEFCTEAQRLWAQEKDHDSPLNMVGAQLLSIAYMGHGKNHEVLKFLAASVQMGERLGLFGTDETVACRWTEQLPPYLKRQVAFTAWGVFNYSMLISLFYSQPDVQCPSPPPSLSIPQCGAVHSPSLNAMPGVDGMGNGLLHTMPHYMGVTFPAVCEFWRIVHDVSLAHRDVQNRTGRWLDLQEAEMKYREIMAWAESLPPALARGAEKPHHVIIFHMWLHAAVLDIFRPFIKKEAEPAPLRTFPPPGSTAWDAYQASVNQLKHLVVHFRLHYETSTCTMLWQPALIYVANAMIQDVTMTPQWRFYFLACFYGLEALRRPFRVSEVIGRGLLTMLMREDKLSSSDAREALGHLCQRGFDDIPGDIRATFMGDLELAQTNPGAANMENLAAGFEDMAVFQEFIGGYQDK